MNANKRQKKAKIKQDIAKLKAIIARVISRKYSKQYQREQWLAWIQFALTRKLPKNKEWLFTTAFVDVPLITLRRKWRATESIELLLQAVQLRLCRWWSQPLPHRVMIIEQGKLQVPVPYLVREDSAEHIEMLDLFLYEMKMQLHTSPQKLHGKQKK